MPVKFAVIGAGDRGNTYSEFSLANPGKMKVVAVVEPDKKKRIDFQKKYNLAAENVFQNYDDFFSRPRPADALIISTPDNMHYLPAVLGIKKGYNVLIEKPVSSDPAELKALLKLNRTNKKVVGICHVLRYTEFYMKLKKILESGSLGEVITIEHIEPVGYRHMAHSYVRGNWKNSENSSPMILAKCSHDFDIIRWLVGKSMTKVSSFGSLMHFKKITAPAGSTERCTDGCKVEKQCPYSALKIYMNMNVKGWPVNVITGDLSKKGRLKALKESDYGKCVYRSGNNVVDHQSVIMEFKGGATAVLTMSGFTHNAGERRTRVMCTHGEAILDAGVLTVYDFNKKKPRKYFFSNKSETGKNKHFGGDDRLLGDFINAVKSGNSPRFDSILSESIESHLAALEAENSRIKI
ncbi:MAG: Gfo/Idh/MocA family oxidoreductase [Ignavibacteria bacterium]|nr:Gfo/Idh/MocA family oxidoreductase [Ignavibacteria bacterium]